MTGMAARSCRLRYTHVTCRIGQYQRSLNVRPRARERQLRGLAGRRKRWSQRHWRISEKGNPYINADGFNLVVAQSGDQWRVTVQNRSTGKRQNGLKAFFTQVEA